MGRPATGRLAWRRRSVPDLSLNAKARLGSSASRLLWNVPEAPMSPDPAPGSLVTVGFQETEVSDELAALTPDLPWSYG